ncbi:MAG: hypothetical protein DESF_00578 [Desulfovibrio sp.]
MSNTHAKDVNDAPAREDCPDQERMERLADFFNEVGMLRHTPRTGYAFLGSGKENVAEHSYRVSVMGYVLARMSGIDPARVTFLCLFHDLHEARTGDLNYVNHRYGQCLPRKALEDCVRGTGLEDDVLPLWDELAENESPEAMLAHDADQLDLICNLKAELDKGNAFAGQWLESAVKRLRSAVARELADVVLRTDHNRWWYGRVEKEWWVRRGRE